ncbi:MAG: hypothetical protein KDD61_11305, partial [Bdellovibrionales bacterium]|nr:hypothetical protein [Bdellovibrionales bacterium]
MKILILLFITVPLVTDLSAVAEPNIKRISEASQNAPNLQKKSEKGDDPLVPSESESPRPLLSPRESLFFKAITLNFRSPNMDFEFEPEDSNLDSLQYDSNSSYLFGVSTETQLGYFSFALPVYKAGEPEESDKSTSRVITDAFDLRYELALGGHTVWRAKYLKYKGFYKKEASTTEILRDDINASTIELTGFYYLTPESFPTNRQSDLTNGFAQKGSSMFVFASLFQNSIKGKDPLVDSKYDIFLGKNKGFTEVNAQGLSVGGGYGYNHLAKNNKLSLVGILGAGGNYQTR